MARTEATGQSATAGAAPTGAAGGDLTGTYPNPTVGSAKITTAKLAAAVTLDAIATANATAADVAVNSHKLTGLAAGTTAGDSLRYEQVLGTNVLAVSNLGAGSAGQVLGGTTPSYVYPPGYEINYTAITSTVNVVSTTESSGTTIISPGAVTFDGGLVLCHFQAIITIPTALSTTDQVTVSLFESSTQITRLTRCALADLGATGQQVIATVSGFYRFTPTAAAHTYTVTAFTNSTTGTPSVVAGSGSTGGNPPAFIRFTKV